MYNTIVRYYRHEKYKYRQERREDNDKIGLITTVRRVVAVMSTDGKCELKLKTIYIHIFSYINLFKDYRRGKRALSKLNTSSHSHSRQDLFSNSIWMLSTQNTTLNKCFSTYLNLRYCPVWGKMYLIFRWAPCFASFSTSLRYRVCLL